MTSARLRLLAGAACFALATAPALSQTGGGGGWDPTQARGDTFEVDFETDEGTWMSVDTGPDGSIVFDLLGHIYRMPGSGGGATNLTEASGVALNFHPRLSPDGRRIAFVSDRGGQNNLWVMDADGGNPRIVFQDLDTRITSPAWLPDGSAIVAVREFPTYSMHRRSARIWVFPLDGASPRELVGSPTGSGYQSYWPSPSPDGRYVYYMWSTFSEPLHGLQRGQHIRRIDLRTGAVAQVTERFTQREYHVGTSADLAPEVSPDGRWIAFARRVPGGSITRGDHSFNARTALWIRNLESGQERMVSDEITLDMQGAHGMKNLRVLPGYAWARDSGSLVLWHNGHLRRVHLDGRVEQIPFRARIRRTVSEQARWNRGIDEREVRLRNLRWPGRVSGNRYVFEAAGEIWTAPAGAGEVGATPLVRWTPDASHFMPAVSPDGRTVAFVTSNDASGARVQTCEVERCAPRVRSFSTGRYIYPTWSLDGRSLYALRNRDPEGQNFDLVELQPDRERLVREGVAAAPFSFGTDGRVYSFATTGRVQTQAYLAQGRPLPPLTWALRSYDTREVTSAPRLDILVDRSQEALRSPGGRWIAYVRNNELHVAPWPSTVAARARDETAHWVAATPAVIPENAEFDARHRISDGGAHSIRWIDADTLIYSQGDTIRVHDAARGASAATRVDARLPGDVPSDTASLMFSNARIVTLGEAGVIDNGSVVVRGSRIACVGICAVPQGARVIDLAGATIVPGFIDVHAHGSPAGSLSVPQITPQRLVPDSLYLSHGVTTRLDPGGDADYDFASAEMIAAGRIVGSRALSTGEAIDSGDEAPITRGMSHGDVARIVDRVVDRGAHSIKIFLTSRRDHRQMLVDHARRRGISATNEGADLYYDVSLMLDGSTGWEHPLHYDRLYRDALEFFGRTRAVYSPTLQVATAGLWAEEYWQARSGLLQDPRLRRFLPWQELVRRLGSPTRPIEDYSFPLFAQVARDIRRAGGFATVGGHGELWGLDSQWDIWTYATSMTPLEALTAASLDGARMIGLERDLGSVEVGKLADLVVLARNPLEDIRNTRSATHVMRGGILFDSLSLNRIWPTERAYGPGPGEHPDIYGAPGMSSHGGD